VSQPPLTLLAALAFIVGLAAGPVATAQLAPSLDPSPDPSPDPGFALPADGPYEASALQAELRSIESRYQRAQRLLENASPTDLRLLRERHPDRVRQSYAPHLRVVEDPASIEAWTALYDWLVRRERLNQGLGAAWRIYELSSGAPQRAQALLRIADVYASLGQEDVGRNVAALAYQTDAAAAVLAAYRALLARLRLRITDMRVEAEQALPRICLTLSKPLAASQPIPLADLVSVEPAADALIASQGAELCIAGLAHGAHYTITLHPGLVSGRGEALATPLERAVTVPHRAPSVAFAPGAYVLPRAPRSMLPVRTVNLEEVALELYRVDDRNLVNAVLANLLDQPLARWSRQRLGGTLGARVWTGRLTVEKETDREVVTNLPLDALVDRAALGVYALVAPRDGGGSTDPTQWLVASDLGLTTFAARDGLHVFVRSLGDTQPRPGTELTLVARNNRVLAAARTGDDGYARFASGLMRGVGGDAPALVTARAGDDYNFLALTRPALDLRERGVAGRAPPGPADAFLYTERGVYRPGERVRLSLLLRDAQAVAMPDLPVTVRVIRPGSVVVLEQTITVDGLGAGALDIPLSDSAVSGQWTAHAHLDPGAPAVGKATFQVEDFVPPRIEVDADIEEEHLEPGARAVVAVNARFYYGAAAAGLAVDGRGRIEVDPTPFPAFAGFRFGREEVEFHPIALTLSGRATDAGGAGELALRVPGIEERSQPLRARVTVAVHDVGGRPVYASAAAPIRLHPRYVGLRAHFGAGDSPGVAEHEPAAFTLLSLTPAGAPVAGGQLRWRWVREHYDYVWFSSSGRWSYRTSVIDEPLASEVGAAGADGRLEIARTLAPGRYRLDVFDSQGSASASKRFHVGWWRGAPAPDVPDALTVTLGERVGSRQKAFIDAPFAGRALITLAAERMQRHFEVDLPEDGREIEIEIAPEWSPGLYLMVTAYRPDAGAPSPLPVRAMGLAWLPIGVAERTLDVQLEPPEIVRPRQSVSVPVRVDGAAGERVSMTLAAVDEGVLALTGYETPNPAAHYFAQRALGADARDVYGNLVAPLDAPVGTVRSGGGAAADNLAGVTVRSTQVVALYHRDITVDDAGRATVDLAVPDFVGRLRLMAVAFGARRLGSGAAPMVVRDPVVSDLVLPRFLAAGDSARATLDLRNPGEAPVTVEVRAIASGAVQLALAPERITLGPGEGRALGLALEASEPGVGDIALTVTLPDGTAIERQWQLTVRAPAPYLTERQVRTLAPGETLTLDRGVLAEVYASDARVTAIATAGLTVDVPGLLAELVAYPYGCTEQTVSRALPQLYVDGGTGAFNTITAAIAKVLDQQRSDGQFGTWSAAGHGYDWLTPYTYEFLIRARERGFDVPDAALALTERALDRLLARGQPSYVGAYAAYVLARHGRVKPAVVRRFALNHAKGLPSRLSLAQTAAALALIGDREQSNALFERALVKSRTSSLADYGSDLRDGAAMLALLAEHGELATQGPAIAEVLDTALASERWFSTQEQAWLLVGAERTNAAAEPVRVSIGGTAREPSAGAVALVEGPQDLEVDARVRNDGVQALRVITTVRGAPRRSPPPVAEGYRIHRRYHDVDSGEPVDPATVARGRLLLAVIEGESGRRVPEQNLLVVDLLPAGFEIENAALGAGAQADLPEQVGLLSETDFVNARDDRFVAALRVSHRERFRLAYLVRAITPGNYVRPGVQVEDMYAPRFRARGPAGRTTITVEAPGG
jgi:uncharacterized protein YfaS (alpha-2-macroglobulin family)